MSGYKVPAELVEIAAGAHEQWYLENNKDPQSTMYWSSHEKWVRAVLEAVLPEHEALVRDQAAMEILDEPYSECSAVVKRCALIVSRRGD